RRHSWSSAANHIRVPAGDSLPAPGDRRVSPTGEKPVYKQHRSLPIQLLAHCFYMALHSTTSVKHTHTNTVKQHTAHS
ncbi:unnamed protein product, partial [Staurois parvus]